MDTRADVLVENIAFTTVAQHHDGPKTAKEAVIGSQAEYTAFFDGSPPETQRINWEEEIVIAVALGERRTGGYVVEITSVALNTIGITAGWVFISYIERTPDGAAPDVLTYPYHAVRCQRVGIRYVFNNTTTTDELPPNLFKHWTRSYEDEIDKIEVYRPSNYSFPPARGRQGLELKPNGAVVQYEIGPADEVLAVPGRWEATGSQQLTVYLDHAAHSSYRLTIVSCTDDLLRITREDAPKPADPPPDVPILTYSKVGSIVGYFNFLYVAINLVRYERGQSLVHQRLPTVQEQAELRDAYWRLKPFTRRYEDNPGGPENLVITFSLASVGVVEATEEERVALEQRAEEMFLEVSPQLWQTT